MEKSICNKVTSDSGFSCLEHDNMLCQDLDWHALGAADQDGDLAYKQLFVWSPSIFCMGVSVLNTSSRYTLGCSTPDLFLHLLGAAMPSKQRSSSSSKPKLKPRVPETGQKSLKYKSVPTSLEQSHIDDLDAIAKIETMTRVEVIRTAVELFIANYNADKLDLRKSQLERKMEAMETAMQALLNQTIHLNGQILFFSTLPYTHGTPKQKLSKKGFENLYQNSAHFARLLQSKEPGKGASDLSKDSENDKSNQES